MEGLVFDIQRFSIYDGDGIRTNVFFKGCPLRCKWCHNPESQRAEKQLMFYKEKCVSCGKCAEICGKAFTDECTACGKCAEVCAHQARKISGSVMTAEEVVREVIKDKEFYVTSGGGVTLTGGEPLMQADFAAEILKRCREAGISTAVETCAAVPPSAFDKTLPYLDAVMCDIKCIDPGLHRDLTGCDNRLILENARRLQKSGVKLVFRMPVIPSLNDSEIGKVIEFAGDTPLELMAYHTTGNAKYERLGMTYSLPDLPAAERGFMEEAAEKYGAIYRYTGI